MIRLGVPAGRQLGGERGVDEPGDGHGVRAVGIPLQGERHQLCRGGRPDHGRGVRGCQGRDEQDPLDVLLFRPAGGGQVGVGQVDGRRADARLLQRLPLAQCPAGEQVRRGGAENVVSQVGERYRKRCSGRSPTRSGSAQKISFAIPSGAGIRPQVMTTSTAFPSAARRLLRCLRARGSPGLSRTAGESGPPPGWGRQALAGNRPHGVSGGPGRSGGGRQSR
jgi:hypothetical protein